MEQYGSEEEKAIEQWEEDEEDDWGNYGGEDEFMLDSPGLMKRASSNAGTGEQDMFTVKTKHELYTMVDEASIFSI